MRRPFNTHTKGLIVTIQERGSEERKGKRKGRAKGSEGLREGEGMYLWMT